MFKNSLQFHDRSFRHVVLPPPSASNITITSAALGNSHLDQKKKFLALSMGFMLDLGAVEVRVVKGVWDFPAVGSGDG